MVKLTLSANTLLWQCPDDSGVAIYNGNDGSTIFLRSHLDTNEQSTSTRSSSFVRELTSANIGSFLAVNKLESDKILDQLINWGILIGSDE